MANYDDISESIRLDEVLEELGIEITHMRSGNHWGNCILHDDNNTHFSINEDTLLWNCYVCNEGGRLPKLIIQALDLEGDRLRSARQKAVDWLLPFSDGELVEDPDDEERKKRRERAWKKIEAEVNPTSTPRTALPVFSERVLDRLEEVSPSLLAKWNIHHPETFHAFRIGYDPERERETTKGSYCGPALVIPHFFKGRLVGYQERWLDYGLEGFPDWVPKYTNSGDFPKKETLFNYDRAIRGDGFVIVVESVMSVIRLFELGYDAVATFGANISPQQIRILRSFDRGVYLSYDTDTTGRKALSKLWTALEDIPVRVLPQVGHEKGDLADLPDDEIHDLVARAKPSLSV